MAPYRVKLDIFQGPLDLLLKLIQRQELDITLVSLAVVTDQYLAYLAEMQTQTQPERSPARLADFLHIAGRLLVIKSRTLLPQPDSGEDKPEDDAEEDLVLQLRDYQRYKETAARLRVIEEGGQRSYPRAAPAPYVEARLAPGEVSVAELVATFRKLLASHPEAQPVDGVVAPLVVHLDDCIERIVDLLSRSRRIRFGALMRTGHSRLEVIVTFLALLELIKQQRVRAVQEHLFGEIVVEARAPDAGSVVASPAEPVSLDA